VVRLADIEEPPPFEQWIETLPLESSFDRLVATWTVQALHGVLVVAERASIFIAHAIGKLLFTTEQRYVVGPKMTSRGIYARVGKEEIENEVTILEALECLKKAKNVIDVLVEEHRKEMEPIPSDFMTKFSKASTKGKAKLMRQAWQRIDIATRDDREFSIVRDKVAGMMAVIRLSWVDALGRHPSKVLEAIEVIKLKPTHAAMGGEEDTMMSD
jgi:hypothetical protein